MLVFVHCKDNCLNKVLNNQRELYRDDKKLHGRGIMMAQNIFDSVKYNKTGNSVTLTKNFTKQ